MFNLKSVTSTVKNLVTATALVYLKTNIIVCPISILLNLNRSNLKHIHSRCESNTK